METVLFAVLGTSPSVLTETVWALAQERPAVVPDRVIVLTTTIGRSALEAALLVGDDPGWARLMRTLEKQGVDVAGKLRFGLAADHVRLFPAVNGKGDLADISTSGENEAAADFILRALRSETENPETRILASIAGGRKTMGALLMSCMSLLGRGQDRVLHVLVNPPFDTPLDPPFLFPVKGAKYRTRDGKPVSARPRVDLIDVPFVKMRGWYEAAFKSAPPSYAALVAGVQRQAPLAAVHPPLTLDRKCGHLLIAGNPGARFSAPEFAALCLQFSGTWNHTEMAQRLLHMKRAHLPENVPTWFHDFQSSERFYDDEGNLVELTVAIETLRRLLSSARKKIAALREIAPFAHELLPKREAETTYRKIRLTGPDPFADIRG